MGASAPAPAGSLSIVDLTEGMHDLDVESQSGAEEVENEEEAKLACAGAKRKKRKGRRGGRNKKGKAMEKATRLNKLKQEQGEAADENGDIDSQASSRTVSDDGTLSTLLLAEPYQLQEEPSPYADAAVPNVHVPVLPHYEIRDLPGSSEVDTDEVTPKHGVFATQAIPTGTRLIHELAMITLPSPGDQILELMDAFYDLTRAQQDQIWTLSPCDTSISPLLTHIGAQIADKIRTLTAITAKPERKRTYEELKFLEDVPNLVKASEMCRIAARWHLNRHSLIDLPESQRQNLHPDTPITGLFVETARLRHSCVPNCYAHFNPLTNAMTVHATQDIPAGEELTLSTIGAVYYLSPVDRRAELKVKYGLVCDCPACLTTSPTYAAHETSRLLANTRAVQLNHFVTQLSLLSDRSLCRDLCLRESFVDQYTVPEQADLQDAADTIDELVQNLRDTGCGASPEIVRWYTALIDRIAPRLADAMAGDAERLTAWQGILAKTVDCVRVSAIAFGADSTEVAQAKLRHERLKKMVDDAEEHAREVEESRKRLGARYKKAIEEARKKEMMDKVARMMAADEEGQQEAGVVGKMGKYDVVRD